jgi:hypothetical protein
MATRKIKITHEQREAQRDAAYERGWVDSLRAYDRISQQPMGDVYYYRQGWDVCAEYRWNDPANRGSAPDPAYRKPRI